MKKLFRINFIIICIVLFAVACKPTPEEIIVVSKDSEQFGQEKKEENINIAHEDTTIPEDMHYSFNETNAAGNLSMTINARVNAVKTCMPVLRIEKDGFTQDMVTGIFNYLFPDEKPYATKQEKSKAEIEKELIEARKSLADGTYETMQGFTLDEYEEYIKRLEEKYVMAPETVTIQNPSDGQMSIEELTNRGPYYTLSVKNGSDAQDIYASMTVRTPVSFQKQRGRADARLHYSLYSERGTLPDYNTSEIVRIQGDDISVEVREKLIVTLNEACNMCEGVFRQINMEDDFTLGAAFVVSDIGIGRYSESSKPEGTKAENYAYKLFYSRVIDGVPMFCNTSIGTADHETAYTYPWEYEFISFVVDNNGIRDFTWDNPICVSEKIGDKCELVSFEEAVATFKDMARVEYEAIINLFKGETGKGTINVDLIQLGLVRIREQNADENVGLIIPAWIFYGNNELTNDQGDTSYNFMYGSGNAYKSEPIPLMVINAVDRSIINLSKGY